MYDSLRGPYQIVKREKREIPVFHLRNVHPTHLELDLVCCCDVKHPGIPSFGSEPWFDEHNASILEVPMEAR
jgi:hypothetical protein